MNDKIRNKKIYKKNWRLPCLVLLNINKTNSGETTGTPEDMGYDPLISPQ
ncbi:MAG: hypothetical protein JXB00_20550 [Bacteroidales bacterium]|nr:hypothetical protein [Bacteroidales bacterium]